MTKESVAINGRTWFTYVLRRVGLDLSAFVDEGDSECSEPCVVNRNNQARDLCRDGWRKDRWIGAWGTVCSRGRWSST